MYKILSFVALLMFSLSTAAQTQDLKGMVMDGQGKPLQYATVSLLRPEDSTLAFFGISNASGVVEVKKAAEGAYVLQTAMMGYMTFYKKVTLPVSNNDLGVIILEAADPQKMKEVIITGERVPLLIKKDTVEYNAGAFKTKPDATVEELLKKLPGVEVDRAGNIKAQGETVNKVFVDGKEFFGDDPKVATKNLPADAINKVQVFDKKSDMTEFTGIDDGSRERTINLMLKDGKKQGYFGDVTVGGGTNERFKGAGKLYRFRPKSQFAAMGMANNINRSGFSFSDYLNFSGGLQNLMSGGGLELSSADNLPIDMGMPTTGIVTSGAVGLNYSYELARNRRINISYMGNGANKKVNEQTWSRNFLQDEDYQTNGSNDQVTDNMVHRMNVSVRNDMDSFTQATLNASAELSDNRFSDRGNSSSAITDVIINTQQRTQAQTVNAVGGKLRGSLTRRSRSGKDVVSISGNGNYKQNLQEDDWSNITTFFAQPQVVNTNLFRDDKLNTLNYGGNVAWSHSLGKSYFIEPKLYAGNNTAHLNREQGISTGADVIIDSLSPDFKTSYSYLRPGVSFKRGAKKVQYNVDINYELGTLQQQYNNAVVSNRQYGYILPSANWRYEYATSKHLSVDYNTSVSAPGYNDLLSVPVISGPLSVSTGNGALKPEYRHNGRLSWMMFDAFSMTSLFVHVGGDYTRNKINRAVTIDNNLAQFNSLANVPEAYGASLGAQFDRPISKLGIKVSLGVDERYSRDITLVNSVQNQTSSMSHQFRLGIENRKKEHWDASIGATLKITDTRYSLQQNLNNVFYNTGGYAELSYRPNDHWYFMVAGDVTHYNQRSFGSAVIIPLVRSEISYYFLKGNRGVLTLDGFDLLNGNKGLQRISQQNYLAEVRSNIVGRYAMLSFKYRLNKAGKKSPMMIEDIRLNAR